MSMAHLFLGFEGRISRGPFWLGLLFVIAVTVAVLLILGVPFFPETMEPFPARVRDFVIQLIAMYPIAAIFVKRLHDRDYPAKYAAWLFGPFLVSLVTDLMGITGDPGNLTWLDYALAGVIVLIGLAFLIDLGFRRGTVGENRFGPDPLGADATGPDRSRRP
jgi:uncharacterized membrane protein YhaH (DUF805 family)